MKIRFDITVELVNEHFQGAEDARELNVKYIMEEINRLIIDTYGIPTVKHLSIKEVEL